MSLEPPEGSEPLAVYGCDDGRVYYAVGDAEHHWRCYVHCLNHEGDHTVGSCNGSPDDLERARQLACFHARMQGQDARLEL